MRARSRHGAAPRARGSPYAALQHPFEDARLTVDPDTEATRWAADQPNARWLRPITTGPQARWLNSFQDLGTLPGYLRAARSQHTLPVLVAYAIPNRGCSNFTEGLPYGDYDRYRRALIATTPSSPGWCRCWGPPRP